jgi:nucleoid DNA-binding protein
VTKKEIVKEIADRANLTQLATKEIVQWTFDAIVETLCRDGRIELRNFGVFEVKQRKPRKARNPRTGEAVNVGSKNVVTFKPGKEMEERVAKMTILPHLEKPTKRKKPEGIAGPDGIDDHEGAEEEALATANSGNQKA